MCTQETLTTTTQVVELANIATLGIQNWFVEPYYIVCCHQHQGGHTVENKECK